MQLCSPAVTTGISAARESVEQYLRNTFDEIGRLQAAPEFLQNVETIQEKTQELDTWKVQREQLSAVEQCSKACTCDEGALLVIAEYNSLAEEAEETAGLVTVPLPTSFSQPGFAAVGLILLAGVIYWAAWSYFRPS